MTPETIDSAPSSFFFSCVNVGLRGGAIGFMSAPYLTNTSNDRNMQQLEPRNGLKAVKEWGAQYFVSLLEIPELIALSAMDLTRCAKLADLRWFELPITEHGIPDDRFLVPWAIDGPRFARELAIGARIVICSRTGHGRAAMVTALVLRMIGEAKSIDAAIDLVLAADPKALLLANQVAFLRKWDRLPYKRNGRRIRRH